MSRRKIKKPKIKIVINGERRSPSDGLEKQIVDAIIEQAPKIHGKLIFKDKEDSDPKDDVHELVIPGGDEWI